MAFSQPLVVKRLGQIDMMPSELLIYDWEIRNFDQHSHRSSIEFQTLVSKPFTFGEEVGRKSQWHLECKGHTQYVFILIVLDKPFVNASGGPDSTTQTAAPIDVHYECSYVQQDGSVIKRDCNMYYTFTEAGDSTSSSGTQMNKLWPLENPFVEGNVLRVQVKLQIFGGMISNPQPMSTRVDQDTKNSAGLVKLQNDLENLYENNEYSDFVVKFGDKVFPVHKSILAARSKVFAAMMKHDMREAQTKTIEIEPEDLTAECFEILLKYIYTAKFEETLNIQTLAGVIPVADKYGLDDLKIFCLDQFRKCITKDNFEKFAILTHLHDHDKNMKDFVKGYYDANCSELMKNREFRKAILSYPAAFFSVDSESD